MILDDIATPALLIESARLGANIDRMQARADTEGVKLRPHTKTHKSTYVAGLQRERGAAAITVAKVSEAEVFIDAGFDDVRIAYEVVGRDKFERLAALNKRAAVSTCVDTAEGALLLADSFASAEQVIDVLVEVDTGHGRCGLAWDDEEGLVEMVRLVEEQPSLAWQGVLTHAGHAYRGPDKNEGPDDALIRHSGEERDRILHASALLAEAGYRPPEISVGSTPTMARFRNADRDGLRITEIRPGNYVYNDAIQVGLGCATLAECALSVLATVISKRRDRAGMERLYLDAGKKVVTTDHGYGTNGYGIILYNARTMTPLPHAVMTALSEEHAWVEVHGGSTLQVGDRVRFVPNHACVAVDTRDRFFLVDGEEVLEEVAIDARGRNT